MIQHFAARVVVAQPEQWHSIAGVGDVREVVVPTLVAKIVAVVGEEDYEVFLILVQFQLFR